jgi:hypothetical protein
MSKSENHLPDSLRVLQHCPVCQGEYPKDGGSVLEEKQEARLLHLTCTKCRHAVIALVVTTSFGVSSVGMLTDLNFKDGIRLKTKGAITENELLSFHLLLKNNQFNFKYYGV